VNLSGVFAAILAFLLATALIIWLVLRAFPVRDRHEWPPSLASNPIVDRLQIARGERPSSALWILCSRKSELRLVLYTRLPIGAEYVRNGTMPGLHAELSILARDTRTSATILNAPRLKFEGATWRRDAQDDFLFTPPLSPEQLAILRQAFLPNPPEVVRLDAAETGTEMRGSIDGNEMSDFITGCAR